MESSTPAGSPSGFLATACRWGRPEGPWACNTAREADAGIHVQVSDMDNIHGGVGIAHVRHVLQALVAAQRYEDAHLSINGCPPEHVVRAVSSSRVPTNSVADRAILS